jgi:hypothetical protein
MKNFSPETQARVVWSDSSKTKISEEEKRPGSGDAVSFEFKGAASLPAGDYLVELFSTDPGTPGKWMWLGSKSFRIGPKGAS